MVSEHVGCMTVDMGNCSWSACWLHDCRYGELFMVSEHVGCITVDIVNCSWSVSMLAA